MITVEINGKTIPIINQIIGRLPMRLANNAVTNGILKKKANPKEKKMAAPILIEITQQN